MSNLFNQAIRQQMATKKRVAPTLVSPAIANTTAKVFGEQTGIQREMDKYFKKWDKGQADPFANDSELSKKLEANTAKAREAEKQHAAKSAERQKRAEEEEKAKPKKDKKKKVIMKEHNGRQVPAHWVKGHYRACPKCSEKKSKKK